MFVLAKPKASANDCTIADRTSAGRARLCRSASIEPIGPSAVERILCTSRIDGQTLRKPPWLTTPRRTATPTAASSPLRPKTPCTPGRTTGEQRSVRIAPANASWNLAK
jgi:hypothetical protein